MSDVIIHGTTSSPVQRAGGGAAGAGGAAEGGRDFKSILLDNLNKVNELQQQADQGVQQLLTGQTDNVSEVLGNIRKADAAFSLLLEIRNKLLDAYNELKQMRV